MSQPAAVVAPYPLAMVICDSVWVDPWTGKKTILGTFSNIVAASFPAAHPPMTVYLAFTDARGMVSVKVRLVDADEEKNPLAEVQAEVECPDQRAVMEMIMQLSGIAFPAAGEYRLQAYAGSEFLIERRIVVVNPPESRP